MISLQDSRQSPSLFIVGSVAGAVAAFALDSALVAMAGVLALGFLWRLPAALVVGYAMVGPLQPVLLDAFPSIPRYVDEVVVLFLSVCVLGPRLWRRPGAVLADPFVGVGLLFVGCALVTTVYYEAGLVQGLAGLFVTFDYFLLFLILRQTRLTEGHRKALLTAVFALAVAATVMGGLQQFLGPSWVPAYALSIREGSVFRAPSLFLHPNDFGYLMLTAFCLAAAALVVRPRLWSRVLVLICVVGLLLSVSRSSYLGACVAVVGGLLALDPRLAKRAFLPMLVVAVVAAPIAWTGVQARMAKIQREGGDARLTYAIKAAPMIEEHLLFGVGPGRFGGEVANRFGTDLYQTYGIVFNQSWTTVDSFWLHLMAEGGLVGVGLFLALMALLILLSLRRLREGDLSPSQRILVVALPMLVWAYGVVNLTAMAFEANTTSVLFWVLAGAALSDASHRRSVSEP